MRQTKSQLLDISSRTNTSREVALLRKELLLGGNKNGVRHGNDECEDDFPSSNTSTSLPLLLCTELKYAVDDWLDSLKGNGEDPRDKADANVSIYLRMVLDIHRQCSTLDSVLHEELGRQGTHSILRKVMQVDIHEREYNEELQDSIIEMQDLAGEILIGSSADKSKPRQHALQCSPFTQSELIARLPLVFFHQNTSNIPEVYIHQVTQRQTQQKDVGFVMWPSAVALSVYVSKYYKEVFGFLASTARNQSSGTTILELGSGCGMTGIFVALLLKERLEKFSVTLTDFNPVVLQNIQQNVSLNSVDEVCTVEGLDFYEQRGGNVLGGWLNRDGKLQPPVDLVLGADIICQDTDSRAVAKSIYDTLKPGGKAYILCANAEHRFGVDCFEKECVEARLYVDVHQIIVDGDSQDEAKNSAALLTVQDLSMTCAYVEGMSLVLFVVRKGRDSS